MNITHRYKHGVRILRNHVIPWQIRWQIREIVTSNQPLIIGPWLSEVGFELLYWIPFLNWVNTRYKLPRDRTVVVSRGGTEHWYGDIGCVYFDILDLFGAEEFNRQNEQRISAQGGGRKHTTFSQMDHQVIEAVKQRCKFDRISILHPSLMYRLFRPFLLGEGSIRFLQKHTIFRELPRLGLGSLAKELPSDYIAVKFYSSNALPNTPKNNSRIMNMTNKLTRSTNIVSLDIGMDIDDHHGYTPDTGGQVVGIKHLVNPSNNLDVQTRIVSNAKAFVGTYGGFSYLAPLLKVPSLSIYSEGQKLATHMYVAARAFSQSDAAPCLVLDIKDLDVLPVIFGHGMGLDLADIN